MATAVKTARVLQASVSNGAGSTTTGTALSEISALGAVASLTVVNGGTGPTIGCDAIIETSTDNSTFREYTRQTAGLTASTTYTFQVEIPPPILYVRSKFTSNTAQAVTVAAELHELTSVG